jgi:geranylgeranyl pyrophosphate synthase
MTVWKSGALVAMACRMGAALATDDEEVLELVATFGSHVGVIAQLLNDSAALIPHDAMHHTDILRRKKTLPISFALHYAREKPQAELLQWVESYGDLSPTTCARIATAMQELGSLHYAWVVADTHRREALAALRTLQTHLGRREVWALRRLIPPLRAQRTARRGADA